MKTVLLFVSCILFLFCACKSPKQPDVNQEFDDFLDLRVIPVNDTTIQTLYLTGKIWGLLKYYHPAIDQGNYNWDAELFRFLPKVHCFLWEPLTLGSSSTGRW